MKKVILVSLVMLLAFGTTFAIDLTMDAERDPFYNTLTGPADGYIHLGLDAQGIDQAGAEDEYDINALVWLAWDSTYFYLYGEITDELVQVNNATQYENDAVELKIDPDPSMSTETTTGVAAFRMSALSEDEAEVPEAVQNVDSGEDAGPDDWAPVADEDYARKEVYTDERAGYNVEFRIPFTNIVSANGSAYGEVGWIMGLAINVMDNDTGVRDTVLRWASNMADQVWNDPYRHGQVTFLEGNKVNMSTENYITGIDTNTADYNPPATLVASNFEAPTEFSLAQNYPNPFNPSTTIAYSLPAAGNVMLKVYDLSGHEVATVVNNQVQQAGVHTVTFDASDLSSGIYFYQLQTGTQSFARKMTLVR